MKDAIKRALAEFFSFRHPEVSLPSEIPLVPPRDPSHGDFSSNICMICAKSAGLPPRQLAEQAVEWINAKLAGRAAAELAGPGFLNFRLASDQVQEILRRILAAGGDYGRSDHGGGRKVNLEFVSANPTGPPVVVSARAAAVGSTLARLLDAAGYDVTSEYYFNDAGAQIDALGASLRARWRELRGETLAIPENGYHGQYLVEMARELETGLSAEAEAWNSQDEEASLKSFAGYAVSGIKDQIESELERFRSHFDVWFREASLHEDGKVDEVLAFFEEQDLIYEEDGARWFRSSKYGDEKDRVVVRSDGRPTYFLNDAAYHMDKLRRGFDKVINILGPDHHAHVTKMQAIASAIGAPEGWLEIVLLQWVTLVEDGETVSMSKRAGEFVTMGDLVEDVGVDVARAYFLTRRCNSHLEFDLSLAREQSSRSRVFYPQYATARIAGVLRKAEDSELTLIKLLEQFSDSIKGAAEAREPNRLFNYLCDVASGFHKFYHECYIVGEDRELSLARLALAGATRQVLKNGLDLMGVEAPERM